MRNILVSTVAAVAVIGAASAAVSSASADTDNRYFVNTYKCSGTVTSRPNDTLGDALGVYGTEVQKATKNGGVLNVVVARNGVIVGGVGFNQAEACGN